MEKKFVMTAFGYAILGLLLGMFMGMSGDHSEMPTHAHIMLIGFVVSFVYALCHKFWIDNATTKQAKIQFFVHQIGTAIMVIGLYLMFGGYVESEIVEPVLGIGSTLVFIAMVMMKIMVMKSYKTA